jgi:outer membrane receptor protein involved in Fe transport
MSQQNPYTISPIAAAVSAALATPGAAIAQQQVASAALEEIIVTATKREQNLQKIPASIHALPEAMLKEIGALNTEDYVRFMPSVNWINYNTGGNNAVIFRGANTDTSGGFTGTQTSSVYLDEMPITSTDGTQPDIRMMDVKRTEALSGPQGTLFGAAAQAGTLRIITNKPDASKFEASADVNWRNGSDSAASHSVTGMINLPLVEDVFAIRIAAQSAEDGGYIDNVPGHTPDTWFGETAAESAAAAPPAWVYGDPYIWRCEQGQGDCVWGTNRLTWGGLSNDDVVEDDWNNAEFAALRVQARWHINDNWMVTAAYHYGDTESHGSSAYNPFVGDLETVGFVKNFSHSEWDMKALTIEADLGFAQLVSATSFYENQRTYVIDNTLYYKYYTTNYCGDQGPVGSVSYTRYYWEDPVTNRAIYLPLYCVNARATADGDTTQIADFAGVGEGPEWQERFTQEIRLSYQGEKFDWLAGLYYEDSNDSWNSVWMKNANLPYNQSLSYGFLEACANNPPTGVWGDDNYLCASDPYASANSIGSVDNAELAAALVDADHYWDSRDDTDWEKKAVFGEVTWHASDKTDVTFGGRWFETTNDKLYIKYLAGHQNPSNGRSQGGFIQPVWRGNDIRQSAKVDDFVPKLSVTYNIDDDKMVYGLYTEGFRVGGINRANRRADWSRTLWGQVWEPDKMKNHEIGLKSRWANNTVQLNLTGFYMDWEDFQHEVVDPSGGDCIDIADAQIPGDPQSCSTGDSLPWISIVGNVGDAHITGATVELDWVPADGWQIGANAQWLEAEIDSTTSDERAGIEKGQKMPSVPEFQGSLWATYSWPANFIDGAEMFLRGQCP